MAMTVMVPPTEIPAIAPGLRTGEEVSVPFPELLPVAMETSRVGVRTVMEAFLVIKTESSGAAKPDTGTVTSAPPVASPPTAVRMKVGTV